jgi:DNA-binding response OmpR family regulator
MSTGIGLSLVKSLVKTYRGDIKVFSNINEGTEFLVFLPYKKESFKEDEVQRNQNEPASFHYSRSMLAFTEQQTLKQPAKKSTGSKTKSKEVSIVIVEDNIELNNYLFNELKEEYNVYTAFNGKEGLNLVQKHLPNIVISDVMMPEMDGIELCNTLKADINTSHIPVFLLTAKSEETHHLEGLNVGADDYITKPFSIDILKLRIANAIKNRKLIIEKFSVGGNSIPDGINISPIDQDLLQKIVTYVENNIDNDITSDKLAAELGLSKSNLYKKLKDLTGFSVNIYIRNIRLNIAAQLLKQENYSISDVAYAVGFNNPKYFSSCFMKYFGKSPRDFMLSQKAENDSGSKSDDNRTTPAPEK